MKSTIYRIRNALFHTTTAPVKMIPLIRTGGFIETFEYYAINGNESACCRECQRTVSQVFRTLPPESWARFYDPPQKGRYVARARFFSALLRPVLSERDYHAAMYEILQYYRRHHTGELQRENKAVYNALKAHTAEIQAGTVNVLDILKACAAAQ